MITKPRFSRMLILFCNLSLQCSKTFGYEWLRLHFNKYNIFFQVSLFLISQTQNGCHENSNVHPTVPAFHTSLDWNLSRSEGTLQGLYFNLPAQNRVDDFKASYSRLFFFFFTWLLKTSLSGQPVLILNCLVTIIFSSHSNNLLFCVMINIFSHVMHLSKEHTSVILGHELLSFNCPDALPLNLLLSILYWGRSEVMSKIGQI